MADDILDIGGGDSLLIDDSGSELLVGPAPVGYASFLADAAAVRDRGDWLVEFYLKNAVGVEEIVRLSRRGTSTGLVAITVGADVIPANTLFRKRVLKAPVLRQALWQQAVILGSSLPSFGSLVLNNRDGGLDRYRPVEGYRWAGCRCKVFFCDSANVQATIGKVFDGQLDTPRFGLKIPVEVPLRGRESLFETKLSERVFRGSWHQLELAGARIVNFGSPAPVNITGNMTAEGWFWLESAPASNLNMWGWLVGGLLPWLVVLTATRQLRFACHAGGVAQNVTTSATLSLQKPYHVALAVNGRDVVFHIWDEDAQTLTTEIFVDAISSATRDLNVGGQLLLQTASTWSMWFDGLRVWNVARTAAQIAGDRFRPFAAGAVPASCVHYAPMQDGTGTTVTDRSATAANGTISGAGTSTWLPSMEGGPDMAGTPKQDIWGRNFGVPCVLVDPVRNAYLVAGGGAVNSIASSEGALAHTMATPAANFRAYLTTTPSAGQALAFLARGLFRLAGVPPTLPVAATVLGYSGGPLGYVETTAPVMRDMVTRFGPKLADPADLDKASFTAMGSMAPAVIGMVFPEPVEMREALDFAGSGAQAWWGYVRASVRFAVAKFTGPAGSADYSFDQRHIIDVTEAPASPVVYQVIVRYQRSRTVLSEEQVAASVKGTEGWQRWTKEWLETAPQTDEAIRADYPGSASVSLTFDTPLYYEADAVALAASLLALLKGVHEPLLVTLRSPGFELTPGKTISLGMTLQNGVVRMGLDGTRRFALNSIEDNRQDGTVSAEVWR